MKWRAIPRRITEDKFVSGAQLHAISYVYLIYQIPRALVRNAADSFSSAPICKSRHAQVATRCQTLEALIILPCPID